MPICPFLRKLCEGMRSWGVTLSSRAPTSRRARGSNIACLYAHGYGTGMTCQAKGNGPLAARHERRRQEQKQKLKSWDMQASIAGCVSRINGLVFTAVPCPALDIFTFVFAGDASRFPLIGPASSTFVLTAPSTCPDRASWWMLRFVAHVVSRDVNVFDGRRVVRRRAR
jgi:hypothetical protein